LRRDSPDMIVKRFINASIHSLTHSLTHSLKTGGMMLTFCFASQE